MAHVEFKWMALRPFRAEHPLGSGTVVEYKPGDYVPADEWGIAAHHMASSDTDPKIARMAINVSDPGDEIVGLPPKGVAGDGLSDPTRQYLAYEGKAPLTLDEPTLEEPADETAGGDGDLEDYPIHVGGPMYELSDGSRVRGKQAAADAQAALGAG